MPDKDGNLRPPEDFNTEEVNRRLEEEKKQHGPSQTESITTPLNELEETEKKRQAVLSLVTDVKRQGEDIDRLNQSMTWAAEQIQKIALAVNQQTEVLNKISNQGIPQGGNDVKSSIAELLNSPLGERLMDKLLPNESNVPAPLIDQNTINQKMTKAFMDDLETGESIRSFISDSLKKKATKEIVNKSLGNIGREDIHGPA